MQFGRVSVVSKIRVSLRYTPCHVGVHLLKVPRYVKVGAKPVNLCTLGEAIELRRLGTTHRYSGGVLWIRVVKPTE